MNIQPITKNPEFAAALAKLNEYRAALAHATEERERLATEALHFHDRRPESNADVLAATDAMLTGNDPARADLAAQQEKNRRLIEQLRKALAIQDAEVRRIAEELSRKACKAVHAEYAPLVQNVMNALDALVAANAAVTAYRQEFDALGYDGLIRYTFTLPGGDLFDPHDRADAFASSWWRIAEKYVQHDLLPHQELPTPKATPAKPTAAQRVAAVAKALGHRANNPDVGELVR